MTGNQPQPRRPRSVTVRARGHGAIRASHRKTIELVEATDITARATCVIGVDAAPLGMLEGLRGPLAITLRAGGREDRVTAHANPRFSPEARAVVRCSDVRSPETLAVRADKAAAGLDRSLVAALGDPATELLVTVAESATSPEETAVVLLASPAVAEAAAAAGRLPPDLTGLSLVLASGESGRSAEAVARRAGLDGVGPAADPGPAWQAVRRGGAVLVVGDLERPERPVAAFVRELVEAGVEVRAAAGVDPLTAALVAAGLPGAPRAVLGAPPRSRRQRERQLHALAALGVAGVWTGPYTALAAVAGEVAARWHGVRAVLSPLSEAADEALLLGTASEVAEQASSGARAVGILVAAIGEASATQAEPAHVPMRHIVAGLLREQVPARTVAAALQHATGLPRRTAYALVLEVKGVAGR